MKILVSSNEKFYNLDEKITLSKLTKKHIMGIVKFIDKNIIVCFDSGRYLLDFNGDTYIFTNLKQVKSFIKNNIA